MYVIENKMTRPQYNLALEEYLCARSTRDGSRFFMLWQNEPSIIVGRFQNTLAEINADFVENEGIHVVRRNSGGGAVYHDLGNINYSFIVPDENADFDFALFTQPVINALAALGVAVEHSGRNDIAIDGKKISGGAQFRRGGTVLHHGTLLYDTDLDILSRSLNVSEDKFKDKAVKSVRSRVTNIRPYLLDPLPVSEFQQRFQREIQGLIPLELGADALAEVSRLEREKYATRSWNYGVSPRFTEHKKKRFLWGGIEAFLNVEDGSVADCSFHGDYFGSGETAPLLELLRGTPYTRESVRSRLENFDFSAVFAGATAEEMIALLSPDI